MKEDFAKRLLSNIVSPYGLAMISYAVFLLGCVIPRSTYSYYMHEPDMLFLDSASILLYTLCTSAFLLGVWLFGWLFPSDSLFRHSEQKLETRIPPLVFLLIPLIAGTVLADVSRILLLKSNPMLFLALAAQQGGAIKGTDGLEISGISGMATMLLTGIVWWAIWRLPEMELHGWRRVFTKFALALAIASVMFSALIVLSRSQFMMFVSGWSVLYMVRKMLRKQLTWRFISLAGFSFICSIIFFFFLFSFLRGTSSWDDQISTLLGYTLGSYNRMAAVLNGSLHYPYAGRGLYLSPFVAYNNSLHIIFPIDRWMHLPTYLEVFNNVPGAVDRSGLPGNLFWSGAFGDIFSDLGWLSPLFLFGYGLMYGIIWKWMKTGKALGIILYPCFAFCILFWIGTNYLLASDPAVLLVMGLLLVGYEFLFVRRIMPLQSDLTT